MKALQEKLRDYKFLIKHKIGWKEIKRIIGIRKSNYYHYVSLQQKIGIKGLVVKKSKRPKKFSFAVSNGKLVQSQRITSLQLNFKTSNLSFAPLHYCSTN